MSNNFKKERVAEKSADGHDLEERVVAINRSSKTVKGGRNFSFSAIVVVGDHNGNVGIGVGKANEVVDAIKKGVNLAKANQLKLPLHKKTIPHDVEGKHSGSKIVLRPASEGTGVIAGGAMRAVLELAGYRDVLAKSLGSSNSLNVVHATMNGLLKLESRDEILSKRGLKKENA
jgi:small subunit ribosomal protein S5